MSTIRCPHCGSSAMPRGNQWECGWCGDFGWLPAPEPDLDALEQGVFSILQGMQVFYGKEAAAKEPTWQLTTYCISKALIPAQNCRADHLRQLQAFYQRYPVCTAEEVLRAAKSGQPAFDGRFRLGEGMAGTFWQELPTQMLHGGGESWPDWLCKIVDGMGQVDACFSDEDRTEEWYAALEGYWRAHWLHGLDLPALERMVRRWDLPEHTDVVRDFLLAAFADAASYVEPETLPDLEAPELLQAIYEKNPTLAVQMWRKVLDTAQAHLGHPARAEYLLCDLLGDTWTGSTSLWFILKAMKQNEDFARQVFGSAYVGYPQEALLQACDDAGKPEWRAWLAALLEDNPYWKGFD